MDPEPLNTGIQPEHVKIERALDIARHMIDAPRDDREPDSGFWRGIADALGWTLGHRSTAPLSGRVVEADLYTSDSREIVAEVEYADRCVHGARLPTVDVSMSYVLGVMDGLMWSTSGFAFADAYHNWEVRDSFHIDAIE